MSTAPDWSSDDLPAALRVALDAALDRGARLPCVLRLTELTGYTDWGLLVSGRSDRNVRGIVDGVLEAMGPTDLELIGVDGRAEAMWCLIDFGDFVVHVFYHPVRTHYDLESMWNDAPRVDLNLPPEAFDDSDLRQLDSPDPMPPPLPSYRGDDAFGGFDDEFEDEPLAPSTATAASGPDASEGDSEGDSEDESLFED